MNAPALNLVAETTDIAITFAANPGIVLLDREKFDAWYEKLSAEAPTDADVSTNKGRDTLRSFAAKVRSEKAAIDKARLRLTKEWRDMTDQANAAGKEIAARLEGLADAARAPLTAWEEAEKARVERVDTMIFGLREMGRVSVDDTASTVRGRGNILFDATFDPAEFGERLEEAKAAKLASIATLKAALDRLTREEADRAELEKLRAEAAERDRVAAQEAAAAEAERQRVEAERIAEERRVAAEQADAARIADAERAAAERAQREAEERHAAEIAAERAKVAEAERLRQAEVDRIAEIERQREAREAADRAEEQRQAAEQAKRERNRAHRAKIMGETKIAVMAASDGGDGPISDAVAVLIVKSIAAGHVPHTSIAF